MGTHDSKNSWPMDDGDDGKRGEVRKCVMAAYESRGLNGVIEATSGSNYDVLARWWALAMSAKYGPPGAPGHELDMARAEERLEIELGIYPCKYAFYVGVSEGNKRQPGY